MQLRLWLAVHSADYHRSSTQINTIIFCVCHCPIFKWILMQKWAFLGPQNKQKHTINRNNYSSCSMCVVRVYFKKKKRPCRLQWAQTNDFDWWLARRRCAQNEATNLSAYCLHLVCVTVDIKIHSRDTEHKWIIEYRCVLFCSSNSLREVFFSFSHSPHRLSTIRMPFAKYAGLCRVNYTKKWWMLATTIEFCIFCFIIISMG